MIGLISRGIHISFSAHWDVTAFGQLDTYGTERFQQIKDIKNTLIKVMGKPELDNFCGTIFYRKGCRVMYCPVGHFIVSANGNNQEQIQVITENVDFLPSSISLAWSK